MSTPFRLDNRLQNDTETIIETDLLLYLLMSDSRYPWIILVPKVPDASELHELSDTQFSELMSASRQLGTDMMSLFVDHKLNVAGIGNVVRQLHLHHVVRQHDDFAWPNPVWGQGKPLAYQEPEKQALLKQLRLKLVRPA